MNGMKNYLSHGGETELDNFIQAFRAQVNMLKSCQLVTNMHLIQDVIYQL